MLSVIEWNNTDMFKCDKCGLCCMNLRRSKIYSCLDRGDGVCKYYCEDTHLCSIYKNRPEICNVDKMYIKYFSNNFTLDKYYEMNYNACQMLKENFVG